MDVYIYFYGMYQTFEDVYILQWEECNMYEYNTYTTLVNIKILWMYKLVCFS